MSMSVLDFFLREAPVLSKPPTGISSMSTSNLPERRVLVIGQGTLFDEGTAHRLALNSKLQVVRKKYSNQAAFISDLQSVFPDVLILNEYNPHELEPLINSIPMDVCPASFRVVVLRLYSTVTDVYDRMEDNMSSKPQFNRQSIESAGWDELIEVVCQ